MKTMPRLGGLLLVLLCGCQPGAGPSSSSMSGSTEATPNSSLRKVTLALNWFPEAEHGGFYAAKQLGLFEAEGLDVEILPGGPKSPVLQQTASGQVDFCVDNADKVLLARAQQADLVALMAPIQHSPRCILVHAESNLASFEELAKQTGFTLAMNEGQPFAKFMKHKLDLSGLQIAPYPGNVSQFLLNPKFAQQAYSFSEPYVAEQQGAKVKTLMVSDLGFNTYTSLLITSADQIARDRDVVAKMVRASIEGWKRYLQDPRTTNEFIHAQNPEMSLDVLAFGVNALQPLCVSEASEDAPFGGMTAARWEQLTQQMIDSGSLQAGSLKGSAYSLDFLDAAK